MTDYVRRHLPDDVTDDDAPAHIAVEVRWLEGATVTDRERTFAGQGGLDRVGKRLLVGPNCVVWTDTVRKKNLQLRFELHGEQLRIEAIYEYAPEARKVDAQPDHRSRELFRLMSWFIYHPLAWYLEHFRGRQLLHASGIDMSGHGIVIAGVGGVGKTTTGVSLLAHGGRFVSENLIFYDDESIYSCYEPIRVNDESVALLGAKRDILRPATIPDGAKSKNIYQVDRQRGISDSVPAKALFIPRFSRQSYVRSLDVEECLEVLLAFNNLSREVNDADWFASTLQVLWPRPGSLERRARVTRALLERVGRYELGIDRRQGVEPVVQAILEKTLNEATA